MKFPEQFRWKDAPKGFHTKEGDSFGLFKIPRSYTHTRGLKVIATSETTDCSDSLLGRIRSRGQDVHWQHVSVSVMDSLKPPTWGEMCKVKELFWDDDECVVQYHPPKSDYVNNHPGCLHLWKWTAGEFPRPPKEMVLTRGRAS